MKNRKESGSKETLTLSSGLHTSTVRITSKHVKNTARSAPYMAISRDVPDLPVFLRVLILDHLWPISSMPLCLTTSMGAPSAPFTCAKSSS